MDEVLADVEEMFARRGGSMYGGEGVTQQEHALQAAFLAEESGAPAAQIVAALLHDLGHLLHDLPDDAPDHGVDDVHERLAYEWLASRFVPAVAEPVKMHVDAKRYFCAVDPQYLLTLSPPSIQSLALQGGPFSSLEISEFEAHEFFRESVELRRWDDEAKVVGLPTPGVRHFLRHARHCLRSEVVAEAQR